MDRSTDVYRALGWGLRRYLWLVALFVLSIGALVVALDVTGEDVYESKALVSASTLELDNMDVLPRYGESVFNDGAVADSVRRSLGITDTTVSVVPSRVRLEAEQDNVVFGVVGRSSTSADEAETLANLAASVFATEMNKNNPVGTFSIHSPAEQAQVESTLPGGALAIAVGLLAGAVAGVGAVALLLLWRRPVWHPAIAEELTGAPVLSRLRLPRGAAVPKDRNLKGLAALCRRLRATGTDPVLLVSPRPARRRRRQVAAAMEAVFDRVGGPAEGRQVEGGAPRAPANGSRPTVIDEPTMEQLFNRSARAMTLMVVPEGIPASLVRRAADEYLDEDGAGVIFVSSRGWRMSLPSRAAAEAKEEEAALSRLRQEPQGEA